MLGGGQASALPPVQVDPTPGVLLVEAGPPASEKAQGARQAPLSDLNEVLGATRAKLEELTEATALVVADTERRKELDALKKSNERLAAELEQASARRAELERAADLAEARIAELAGAAEAARREKADLNEDLAELRRQNQRLDQSLARTDAAREGALAEAEKIRAETAKKVGAAADEVELLKAELASRRDELESKRQELAEANGAREQLEARVSALEEVVERSGAEAGQLKTELAETKEQLDQAAAAVVAAERARQAAGGEAQALRDEAKRAREELAAARDESARLEVANAELEKQMASLHGDWRSATETARHNLIVMEEKIEELNAALDLRRGEKAVPTEGQAKPEAVEDERDAAPQAPSAMVQPPAPETGGNVEADPPASSGTTLRVMGVTAARADSAPFETATVALEKLMDSLPGSMSATGGARHDPSLTDEQIKAALANVSRAKPEAVEDGRSTAPRSTMTRPPAPESTTMAAGADRPADGAITLARIDPAAPSPQGDSGLADFRADIQALNELEVNAGGGDLFSGVASAVGREVHVSTTAAWNTLPPLGKQSYLDFLLDAWLTARGKQGRALVRIVDSGGQVLAEKSWP